jgi:hypothetical protein
VTRSTPNTSFGPERVYEALFNLFIRIYVVANRRARSTGDRAEIVKWMIEEALTAKKKSSDSTLASDKILVLSTKNIESSWVPIIPAYKILLLTPAEIQQKANRQGDYMYWQFDEIRVSGPCVAVSLSNLWADSTSSIETGQRTLLGERLFNYVFRKQSGKWIGKFITGSIS